MSDPGDVVLRVLGEVQVGEVRVASARGASLLSYLAVAGARGVARDQIAFALWPDRSEDRARRSLSDAVYRLRAGLPDGAAWLVATPEHLALDGIGVDLWRFRELIEASTPEALVEAIGLHGGPLADGVDDEWVDLPRGAHTEAVIGACERVCAALAPADRVAIAERWVAVDPYGRQPHHTLIETFCALGRNDAARRAIDRYQVVLDELGLDDAGLERWIQITGESAVALTPFVGRVEQRGRILRALDRACEGRGGVVVVLGDAGIGKSRLLDEVADGATWRGVDVMTATAENGVAASPFAPLDAALASGLDEVRLAQIDAHLGADVRRSLSRVIPAIGAQGTFDVHPMRAIGQLMTGLAALRPQLLLLDDAQWCGQLFWETIESVAVRLAGARVLVVVAARSEVTLDPAVRSTIGRLEAAGASVIGLTGLTMVEVTDLLRAIGFDGDSSDIHEASGGNPLVALTCADGQSAAGPATSGPATSGPARVAEAFRGRMAQLDPRGRRLVQQAAVLGRSVEYPVLAAACAGEIGDVFRLVLDAEDAGVLERRGGRLHFAHDLVRSAVFEDLLPDDLVVLHRNAHAAVSLEHPDATLRLLDHAESAGDEASIVAHSIAAGTDALIQSAYRLAERHFGRALELIASIDDPLARHAALGGRIRTRDRLADRTGQAADVADLLQHARRMGEPFRSEALVLAAEHRFAIGDFERTLALLEEVRARAAWSDGVGLPHGAGRVAAGALRELGRYDDADIVGRAAAAQMEAAGDELGSAVMTDLLGGIAWRRGDARTAAELHRSAADRFADIGARNAEARALNNLGAALWGIGDDRGAEEVHRRALGICRELEDRRGEGDNLDNLGGVAAVRGDFETAIELYRSALAIRRDTDDPWGVSISLSNLGDAYRALGDTERALRVIDESLAVNAAAGVVRNEATTRQSRGLVLADMGQLDDALTDLRAADAMHSELGDRANLLETRSGILDVLVAADRLVDAEAFARDLAAEITSAGRACEDGTTEQLPSALRERPLAPWPRPSSASATMWRARVTRPRRSPHSRRR